MSRWSSPRRQRLAGARLLLTLSTALGCAASPLKEALAPAVRASPPPVAAEPPVETPPSPRPPADQPSDSNVTVTVDGVVALVAKPNLWPLDIDSARRVLSALGPVKREEPTSSQAFLAGGPFGPLERYEVAYALDDQQHWAFGSAGFVFADRELPRLYRALDARLTRVPGKPARNAAAQTGAPPPPAWDLGDAIVLSVAPSSKNGECRVLIARSGQAIEPEEIDEEATGLIQ